MSDKIFVLNLENPSEKVAINLLKENMDIKFIADVTDLSLDEVFKLKCKI